MWRAKETLGENVGLLLRGAGDLVTKDMEKAEVINSFFALVFTGKTSCQQFQTRETSVEQGRPT